MSFAKNRFIYKVKNPSAINQKGFGCLRNVLLFNQNARNDWSFRMKLILHRW